MDVNTCVLSLFWPEFVWHEVGIKKQLSDFFKYKMKKARQRIYIVETKFWFITEKHWNM